MAGKLKDQGEDVRRYWVQRKITFLLSCPWNHTYYGYELPLCLRLLFLLPGILCSSSFLSHHVFIFQMPAQGTLLDDLLCIGPSLRTCPLPNYIPPNITMCVYLLDLYTFKETFSLIKIQISRGQVSVLCCLQLSTQEQLGRSQALHEYLWSKEWMVADCGGDCKAIILHWWKSLGFFRLTGKETLELFSLSIPLLNDS